MRHCEVDLSPEESAMFSVRREISWIFCFAFLVFSTIPLFASGATIDKQVLVGSWDYVTYTLLKDGKPVGTVQFKPRSMVFTYCEDDTWVMEANDATRTRLNGTYDLHGSELILKKSDGSLYQDFEVEMRNDGKAMLLRDNKSILAASKLDTAP